MINDIKFKTFVKLKDNNRNIDYNYVLRIDNDKDLNDYCLYESEYYGELFSKSHFNRHLLFIKEFNKLRCQMIKTRFEYLNKYGFIYISEKGSLIPNHENLVEEYTLLSYYFKFPDVLLDNVFNYPVNVKIYDYCGKHYYIKVLNKELCIDEQYKFNTNEEASNAINMFKNKTFKNIYIDEHLIKMNIPQ